MTPTYTLNAAFFDALHPLFGGHIEQAQVDGISDIVAAWNCWAPASADLAPLPAWLANMLAQAFHETGRKMQPVAEIGQGRGHDYGIPDPVTKQVYYGRGLVQLTWKANYQLQGARLGEDLEHNPELALRPDLAANVMLNGMAHGLFTGKRLGQYFSAHVNDPVNARRIINGLDCAAEIAGYHKQFLAALGHAEPKPPAAP